MACDGASSGKWHNICFATANSSLGLPRRAVLNAKPISHPELLIYFSALCFFFTGEVQPTFLQTHTSMLYTHTPTRTLPYQTIHFQPYSFFANIHTLIGNYLHRAQKSRLSSNMFNAEEFNVEIYPKHGYVHNIHIHRVEKYLGWKLFETCISEHHFNKLNWYVNAFMPRLSNIKQSGKYIS